MEIPFSPRATDAAAAENTASPSRPQSMKLLNNNDAGDEKDNGGNTQIKSILRKSSSFNDSLNNGGIKKQSFSSKAKSVILNLTTSKQSPRKKEKKEKKKKKEKKEKKKKEDSKPSPRKESPSFAVAPDAEVVDYQFKKLEKNSSKLRPDKKIQEQEETGDEYEDIPINSIPSNVPKIPISQSPRTNASSFKNSPKINNNNNTKDEDAYSSSSSSESEDPVSRDSDDDPGSTDSETQPENTNIISSLQNKYNNQMLKEDENETANQNELSKFNQASFDYIQKIIVLGASGVGKTSYLLRLTDPMYKFERNTQVTIGVDFRKYIYKIQQGKDSDIRIYCQIWDTAGQEIHRAVSNAYYRGCAAAVMMFDVTQPETFERVKEEISILQKHADDPIILIVGNKIDLYDKRKINTEEAVSFCEEYNFLYQEVSVKERVNVKKAFDYMMNVLYYDRIVKKQTAHKGKYTIPTKPIMADQKKSQLDLSNTITLEYSPKTTTNPKNANSASKKTTTPESSNCTC